MPCLTFTDAWSWKRGFRAGMLSIPVTNVCGERLARDGHEGHLEERLTHDRHDSLFSLELARRD